MGEEMTQTDNGNGMKDIIVNAAEECFAENGVKKTTLAVIAARAGVELDDLKALFKTKSLLAMFVQMKALDEVKQDYLTNMPDATLDETIKFIIQTRCKFVEANLERTKLFFINALKGTEPWSSLLDQVVWQLSVEFATLFEKSARQGEIRKDTDINTAVRALTSFYLTGIITMGIRAETFDSDVVWNFIEPQVVLLLNGLRA